MKNRYLGLFLTFFKIGLFTFGGGYAMLPLIEKETVEKHKWISNEDILDIVAIAESTPGPIAINCATFIGYRVGGTFGAFFATFGTVLPSFVIILIISGILRRFSGLRPVRYAFFGIRAGVLALLIKSLLSMYKKANKGIVAYFLMALSFAAATFLDISVVYIILGCALTGLIAAVVEKKRAKRQTD